MCDFISKEEFKFPISLSKEERERENEQLTRLVQYPGVVHIPAVSCDNKRKTDATSEVPSHTSASDNLSLPMSQRSHQQLCAWLHIFLPLWYRSFGVWLVFYCPFLHLSKNIVTGSSIVWLTLTLGIAAVWNIWWKIAGNNLLPGAF